MEEKEVEIKPKKDLGIPSRNVLIRDTLNKIKILQNLGEQKHYYYVRITLIITGLISIGMGIYLNIEFDKYLGKRFRFDYRTHLLVFIYLYSPSAIGIFLVSFILSLFVYSFFCCCEKEKIHGAPLYDEGSITMGVEGVNDSGEIKVDLKKSEAKEYLGINADKVTLFPYTMTIFIVLSIAFYFAALPYSITLLTKLWNDDNYKNKKKFWPIYVFICTNLIDGVLIVVVFFHMFLVKRIENSILKQSMEIDESQISFYRNEVREALKNAK